MNTETPLISIIVPVYNVEKYLHRCLTTITNQTYSNLEIIVIDDGSTDNSGKICDEYGEMDTRINVIHQSNKGLSGARNTGLRNANGQYIGFVDSDDWIELNMLEILIETAIVNNVDVVECNVSRTEGVEKSMKFKSNSTVYRENRIKALNRIITNQSFSVWRRLYKTEVIKDITFVEGKNSEDVYFTLEVFKRLEEIAFVEDELYNYFIGGTSITRGGYRLKTLDTVDAALHLYSQIKSQESDKTLVKNSTHFLNKILLYNYKMLSINKELDRDKNHREKILKLIKTHHNWINTDFQLFLARSLPIGAFQAVMALKEISSD